MVDDNLHYSNAASSDTVSSLMKDPSVAEHCLARAALRFLRHFASHEDQDNEARQMELYRLRAILAFAVEGFDTLESSQVSKDKFKLLARSDYATFSMEILGAEDAAIRLDLDKRHHPYFGDAPNFLKTGVFGTGLEPDFQLLSDKASVQRDDSIWKLPLFDTTSDPSFADEGQALLAALPSGNAWSFWSEWVASCIDGSPLPTELLKEILAIPSATWDLGPESVAAEISRIRMLLATNVAPRLVKTKQGLWDAEQSPTVPNESLEFAIASVEQSLRNCLMLCSENLFNGECDEAIIIQGALDNHRSNPSLLAIAFWQACMSFQANLGSEYPKDDAHLVGLQNTLYTSIEEMCERSELIKKRIGRLAALEPKRELTEEDHSDLKLLPIETEEHLTEQAQNELVEAVEGVRRSKKPARGLQARLANWVTTLGKGLDEGQKHDKRAKWLIDLGRRLMRVFFPGNDDDGLS